MEIRQLKYFVAVADRGSLSRAAAEVFIAQSALSKQIAELEGELGVQLLYRGRTGVTVTEAGKTFYVYARAILKQLVDAKDAVLSSPQHVIGSALLVMPQSTSGALALPLFRAASERLPGVSLHLNEDLCGNMEEQLRQGRVDFMIFTPLEHDGMVYQPLVEEGFVVLGAADAHLDIESGEEVDLDFVSQLPLAMPSQQHSHCTRAIIGAALAQAKLPMNVVAEINSAHILRSAVEAGVGFSVMPYALATHEIAAGRLRMNPIRVDLVKRVLGICHARHIPLTHAKRAVCDLVFDVARELCESGQWVGARYIGPVT